MELVMLCSVDTFVNIICLTEDCRVYCHMKQVVLSTLIKLRHIKDFFVTFRRKSRVFKAKKYILGC